MLKIKLRIETNNRFLECNNYWLTSEDERLHVYISPSVMFGSLWPHGLRPPESSVYGILQARTLEWVAIPFSWGSSWPRAWTSVSSIAGRFFTTWTTREAKCPNKSYLGKTHGFLKWCLHGSKNIHSISSAIAYFKAGLVQIYIFLYVCMFIFVYVYVNLYMYIYVHLYTYIHIYVYICLYICVFVYVNLYRHIYI